MLIVTVLVDAPVGKAEEVKEDLAMHLERFGDAQVLSIEERAPQQLSFDGRHTR